MNMRKFLVSALVLVVAALAFTACGSCATADGTAYAAGNEFYICISPTDDTLAAENNTSALPSSVPALLPGAGSEVGFYLIQSYYYKATLTGSGDSAVYSIGGLYVMASAIPEGAVLTRLPEGATEENALPVLTLAEGASVTLANYLTVNYGDTEYTLRYLGLSADDGTSVVFLAENGTVSIYGTANADSFAEFSVPWHPIAAERRAELLAPDEPADDGTADGDLTGGTPSNALRIILIIGIAVPALLIVFLLFKPSSKRNDTRRTTMRRQDTERGIDYDRERSYESDRERYERGYRDYERRDYPENRGYGGYDRDDDRRY